MIMSEARKGRLIDGAAEYFIGTIMAQSEAAYGKDTETYMRSAPKAFAYRSYAAHVTVHNPASDGCRWFGLSLYDRLGQYVTNMAC